MSPKVSVIIPAYNAGMFVDSAIESVLAQNYDGEIEIIVIDDDSSDNTREVVDAFSRRFPQIVCVPNERSKGPSGARNTGLLKATGQYVAFLDADDLWLPTHLANGIGFLEKNNAIDVVFYNFNLIEYKTKQLIGDWFSRHRFSKRLKVEEIGENYFLICDDMFNSLIDESFIHLQSMVVRKTTLNGIFFNEDVKRSEDRDFCIKLFIFSKAKFAFNYLVTGIYYRHENSLTSESLNNELDTILDHIKLFSSYISIYTLDILTINKLKTMLYHKYMNASYCYRKLKSYKLAAATLYKSFNYNLEVSQFKEFAKIVIAFLIGDALQRRRRPT